MPVKQYASEPYLPNHALVDYSNGYNITFAFFVLAVILLFFKLYNTLLQKCGRATKMFKLPKTKDGAVICDENWEFILNVDEKLGKYWECLRG